MKKMEQLEGATGEAGTVVALALTTGTEGRRR